MSDLCKNCSRKNLCGNTITKGYCTGYQQAVPVKWTNKVQTFKNKKK